MSYLDRRAKKLAHDKKKRKNERKLMKKFTRKGMLTKDWDIHKDAVKRKVIKKEQVAHFHAERRRLENE